MSPACKFDWLPTAIPLLHPDFDPADVAVSVFRHDCVLPEMGRVVSFTPQRIHIYFSRKDDATPIYSIGQIICENERNYIKVHNILLFKMRFFREFLDEMLVSDN
jgi:hypothetical protein